MKENTEIPFLTKGNIRTTRLRKHCRVLQSLPPIKPLSIEGNWNLIVEIPDIIIPNNIIVELRESITPQEVHVPSRDPGGTPWHLLIHHTSQPRDILIILLPIPTHHATVSCSLLLLLLLQEPTHHVSRAFPSLLFLQHTLPHLLLTLFLHLLLPQCRHIFNIGGIVGGHNNSVHSHTSLPLHVGREITRSGGAMEKWIEIDGIYRGYGNVECGQFCNQVVVVWCDVSSPMDFSGW